jgi:hypothetical protein
MHGKCLADKTRVGSFRALPSAGLSCGCGYLTDLEGSLLNHSTSTKMVKCRVGNSGVSMDGRGRAGLRSYYTREGFPKVHQYRAEWVVERIYLEELIQRQSSVAGRATTCWRSFPVGPIKDSWEYEGATRRGSFAERSYRSWSENVARYYHHETVYVGGAVDDVRNNVWKGLQDTHGTNPFQQRRPIPSESITSPATSGMPDRRRGRSNTRSITRKRSTSSTHTSMPPPKRSCSDSPVKQETQRQRNRFHRRVIMRDMGKSIYHASSLGAMLTGLLGGLKVMSVLKMTLGSAN